MNPPIQVDRQPDHRRQDDPRHLTRREALAAGIAALAGVLLPDRLLAQSGSSEPSRRAVEEAAARYRQEKTVDAFVQWTDAARHGGDFDLVRANLRQLESWRAEWGQYKSRIETIWRAVSFKQFLVEWNIGPQRLAEPMWGDPRKVRLAVPHDSSAVQIERIEVAKADSWRYFTDQIGNRYAAVERRPGQSVYHSYTATIGVVSYGGLLPSWRDGDLPAAARAYLGKTSSKDRKTSVDPGGPLCQAVVRDFQLDRGSPPERLAAMMAWARAHIKWLPPGSESAPIDSESALRFGGGHCFHIASAKAAVARAIGIPTRLARGNSAVEPGQPYPLWHTEPEYYLNGLGWIMPAGGVDKVSLDPWATLNGCVWKYYQANSGDAYGDTLQFLEAIEYNPQPRLAISQQRMLKEWV